MVSRPSILSQTRRWRLRRTWWLLHFGQQRARRKILRTIPLLGPGKTFFMECC